jgi:hypothetical protein
MAEKQSLYAYAVPEMLTNEKKLVLVEQEDQGSIRVPVSRNPDVARSYGEHVSGRFGYGSIINLQPLIDSGALSLEKLLDLDKEIAKTRKSSP